MMRGQVKIQQKKLAAKKRRRAFYLSFYALAALVLVLCALSYISGLEALSLREGIVVTGNERLSSSTVEAVVATDLGGTYLGLFPKRNFLLYPRAAIIADLEALPPVKSAKVSRQDMRALAVAIVERSPAATWCTGTAPTSSIMPYRCYVSDEDGYIFDRLATSSDGMIYRLATTTDPLGTNLMPAADFKKLAFFMNELSGLSVLPREIELGADGYVTVVLDGGGKLIVNTRDDLSNVLANIASVISDRSIAPSLADFLSRLDYMKLDIGNKVVYKLRGK